MHRLVCEAFHGESPFNDAVPNHIDMVRTNNRPSNLEWVSPKENSRLAVKVFREMGHDFGRNYSQQQVMEVLELVIKGESYKAITDKTGVAKGTISLWSRGYSRLDSPLSKAAKNFRQQKISDHLSSEQIVRICDEIILGQSLKEVSAKLNIKIGTISALLLSKNQKDNSLVKLKEARKFWNEKDNKGITFGENSHFANLTERKVAEIRWYKQKGFKNFQLADHYAVTNATISKIHKNQSWKGIKAKEPDAKLIQEVKKKKNLPSAINIVSNGKKVKIEDICNLILHNCSMSKIEKELGVNRGTVAALLRGDIHKEHSSNKLKDARKKWIEKDVNAHSTGESNNQARLSSKQVSEIKWYLGIDVADYKLAERFNVSKSAIQKIKHSRSWKDVKPHQPSVMVNFE